MPPATAATLAGFSRILAGMSTAARADASRTVQLLAERRRGPLGPVPGGIRLCSHSSVSLLVSMVWVG